MAKHFYFSSLAINQTEFWFNITKNFQDTDCSILCFDTESLKIDKQLLNLTYKQSKFKLSKIKKYLKKYKINKLKKIFNHEILYFEERDNFLFLKKFIFYLSKLEEINLKKKESIFIQELGGFIPNLAIYFYCKRNDIDHYFIEPSFFKGRFHLTKNSFNDFSAKQIFSNISDNDLMKILENTLKYKTAVIPIKDTKHFASPLKKTMTLRNLYRFLFKIFAKNILKYEFIFYQDLNVLKIFFKEVLRSIKLKKYYKTNLPKNFIYFPMHVPNDVALSMRARDFQDQISLILKIANYLPKNYKLCIKEHPAKIGGVDLMPLINNDKIVILNPKINNFDILKKAEIVITINSKAGFEAILYKKKIISLSNSFYSQYKMSINFDNFENIEKNRLIFQNLLYDDKFKIEGSYNFFKAIYQNSLTGELYDNNPNNLDSFEKSLRKI